MKFVTNKPERTSLPITIQPNTGLPLATQLRQQITWLIATRGIEPGERLPSIRELAAQTGVHYHTVRSAYRQLASDGLLDFRHGSLATVLPFTSLQLARPAAALRTHTVGVLIGGLDPFYLPFLRGVEEVTQAMSALTLICSTGDSPVKARLQIDQLIARGVDGIIAASVGRLVQSELGAQPSQRPFPVVYCDQPDVSGYSITFDAESAAYQAVSHLAGHGHRRIALITAPVDWPNMKECYAGFRRALRAAGIAPDDSLLGVTPTFSVDLGENALQALMSLPAPPTAVFTTADILAIGALRAARRLGVRVPQDLAVVGYTDIELAALVGPPLTTVAAPIQEMGRLAMETLAQLIQGDVVAAQERRLETHLVIRQSCGCG
ncbi:MAG TPA: substrate-binding domain-containing protein [Anaerolineales bacterium]|nr:substrate-binding domain-containing protein [Anaerolineales bacterium]